MQGVLIDLLERVVTDAGGDDAWDDLLDRAGRDGVYTTVGLYPWDEFAGLLDQAPRVAGPGAEERRERLRWFGEQATPYAVAAFGRHVARHPDTVSLLQSLDAILAAETCLRTPGASSLPSIEVLHDPSLPSRIGLSCRAPGGLCGLLEGFVVGIARHYGQHATLLRLKCVDTGATSCFLVGELTGTPTGAGRG